MSRFTQQFSHIAPISWMTTSYYKLAPPLLHSYTCARDPNVVMPATKLDSSRADDGNPHPEPHPYTSRPSLQTHDRSSLHPNNLASAIYAAISTTYAALAYPGEACPICLVPPLLGPLTRLTLPCGHSFCADCLARWLSALATSAAKACPLCRKPYPLRLCLLPFMGGTVALPDDLPARRELQFVAMATLPPWILLFLPTTWLLCFSIGPPPWGFYVLYPMLIAWAWAWVWGSGFVWWRRWTGRGEGLSTRTMVNGRLFVLYVMDEPVPLTLWQAGAMLLIVSAAVVKAAAESAVRALGQE